MASTLTRTSRRYREQLANVRTFAVFLMEFLLRIGVIWKIQPRCFAKAPLPREAGRAAPGSTDDICPRQIPPGDFFAGFDPVFGKPSANQGPHYDNTVGNHGLVLFENAKYNWEHVGATMDCAALSAAREKRRVAPRMI